MLVSKHGRGVASVMMQISARLDTCKELACVLERLLFVCAMLVCSVKIVAELVGLRIN
jgi:hypothetical protein